MSINVNSTPELTTNMSTPSSSNNSQSSINSLTKSQNLCRICLDSIDERNIKYYCKCEGYTGTIHKHCLLRWILEGKRETCEICNHKFDIVKKYRINRLTIFSIIFVIILIILVSVIIIIKFSNNTSLFSILLVIFCILFLYYGKNSSQIYILKSIDVNEIEISETTALIN